MTTFNAKRIARMIDANVKAVNAGRITWEQFGVVNAATWDLAHRGELCVIGSACDRRVLAVHAELRRISGA